MDLDHLRDLVLAERMAVARLELRGGHHADDVPVIGKSHAVGLEHHAQRFFRVNVAQEDRGLAQDILAGHDI